MNLTSQFDASFVASITSTPSGAASVLTVQHGSTAKLNAVFKSAYIYCAAATTITLERSGAEATTTALAVNSINPLDPNQVYTTCAAFSASNVGTSTVIQTFQLAASTGLLIDLTGYFLPAGIADNLTLRTGTISSSATLTLQWSESN